jgi:hypothetical protein
MHESQVFLTRLTPLPSADPVAAAIVEPVLLSSERPSRLP